jgi:hypothetical protein
LGQKTKALVSTSVVIKATKEAWQKFIMETFLFKLNLLSGF